MSRNLRADLPCRLNARLPGIAVRLVAGLRVDHKLLLAVDGKEAGGAMGALGYGRVKIPADAVVHRKAAGNLPCVLQIPTEVIAADGRGPHVLAVGDPRRRDSYGIDKGAAGEKTRQRIGQQVTGIQIVSCALRLNGLSGISGPAAKIVLSIRTYAKVSGVAI